jgi:hypothetical protein
LGYYNKISGEKDDFANNYPLFTNHYFSVTLFDIWSFIIMMNNWRKIFACRALLALAAFLISSCGDWEPYEDGSDDNKHFTKDLRDRWVSNDPSVYSGVLIIDYNTIMITGFSEGQTPSVGGDDGKRPFKGFPKNVALTGYSEFTSQSQGFIFIESGDSFLEIPYKYTSNSSSKTNFITFTFGGREEIMQRYREPDGN